MSSTTQFANDGNDQVDASTAVSENVANDQSNTNNTESGDASADEDGTEDGPYNNLSEEALLELAHRRHLGTLRDIVIGALIEQDRCAEWLRTFRILDLPPELRNLIYIYSMVDERRNLKLSDVDVAGLKRLRDDFPHLGHEMLGIYLGYNTFELDVEPNLYGPPGFIHNLAENDLQQLRKLRPFRRYLRKLIINLVVVVEVVSSHKQMRVRMTLECVPTQVEQTQVLQYTVQAEHASDLDWVTEGTLLRQGVADHIKRHAQSHVDDNEKDFKFTLNGLTKLLSELPGFYHPSRE